jgi:hypothetical protein
VQQRGRDHGKGNSRGYYVADHMIDARSQTGTAPDEQTAMRFQPAHQSLITDVFRSRPPLCTIHHLINFALVRAENAQSFLRCLTMDIRE